MTSRRLIVALDFLGEQYSIKTIDNEDCIYRDIGGDFDIELSGICSRRRNAISIHVWRTYPITEIVESVYSIASLVELKSKLDCLIAIYGRTQDGDSSIQR